MIQSSLIERLLAEADAWDNGSGDVAALFRESADMIAKLQAIIKAYEDLAGPAKSRSQRMKEYGFTKRKNITGISALGKVMDIDE